MPKITSEMLTRLDACQSAVDTFGGKWPDGAEITTANILRAYALKLDVDWLASRVLPAPAYAEFERVKAAAYAEYQRVDAAAWAEFERVTAAAVAEYQRVDAAAGAEFERVTAPARAEFERVRAAALVVALSAALPLFEGDSAR